MTINERWGITDGLTAVLASLFEKKIYENYGSHKIIVAPAGFFGPRGPKTLGGTLGLPA